MATEEIGNILNAIGQHAADIIGSAPEDVFIYAEAADNTQEVGIFQDEGNRVIYYDPNSEMFDEVGRLWDAADPLKKWEVMYYDIKDGQFAVEFAYPESLNEEEGSFERRRRALSERYGEKPVIYPPLPEHLSDLTEDDLSLN